MPAAHVQNKRAFKGSTRNVGRSACGAVAGVLKTAQKNSEQAGHDAGLFMAPSQFFAVCHFRADHICLSDGHISGPVDVLSNGARSTAR